MGPMQQKADQTTALRQRGILIVSEDEECCDFLRECLEPKHVVYEADDAAHSLRLLDHPVIQESVQVLFVDEELEPQESLDVLTKAAKTLPTVQRILMTQCADARSLIDAINRGKIYRFISKPLKAEELGILLENAFASHEYEKTQAQQLERLHERHHKLKTLMLNRLDALSEVLQDLKLPPLRESAFFAIEAKQALPVMLKDAEEMVDALEKWDINKITNLAHQMYIAALSLNTSFETLMQNVQDNISSKKRDSLDSLDALDASQQSSPTPP